MRRLNRETTVFSTSAIDLFASALGAFILLVMILFPYYRNAGSDDAFSRTQEIQDMRRQSAGEIAELLADQRTSTSELQDMDEANRGIEAQISGWSMGCGRTCCPIWASSMGSSSTPIP